MRPDGVPEGPGGQVDLDRFDHVRTWTQDGFTLDLYDTGKVDRQGKSVLAYSLTDAEHGDVVIFQGADFHCSPLHANDSDRTVASLLNFLSLRPGDTDQEHFDEYTEEQLEWCDARAEELSLLAHELDLPYRPLRGWKLDHESWDEAQRARRYNRAITLTYTHGSARHRVVLQAGEADEIDVLSDGNAVYVLTSNFGLGYVGLEVFPDGAREAEAFVQGSEVEECLGESFWDLSPSEKTAQLVPYLGDSCPSFEGERQKTESLLDDLSEEMRERLRTFLRLGNENPWVREAWDPPFNELSFCVCSDEDQLIEKILRGNWCLGQAFVLDDICFINQVDGGDEWLTIKGSTAFESITMQTATESREQAEERIRDTLRRIRSASEEQCRKLDY